MREGPVVLPKRKKERRRRVWYVCVTREEKKEIGKGRKG